MPFFNSLQRILGVIFSPFKPVHDFFKPAYDFLMKTLTVWLTLVGLACVIEGGMKFFGLNDTTAKVLSSIGIAVLVSGVSGVLLRSLEYSDIFKREVNDIIYGSTHPEEQKNLIKLFREELNDLIYGIKDPQERKDIINLVKEGILEVTYDAKVLRNRRDLSDLWKTVSETVYVNRFPDISRDIAERIAGEYFPTENDFYYSKFKEDVSIKFLDGHKKYVVAKETITLTIKPVDNLQSVDWVFGIELEKVPSDKVTSYEIKMLKICGEPS